MKTSILSVAAAVAVIATSFTIDAQNSRRSVNINTGRDRPVTDCGDIQVTYDRRPAITDSSEMTIPAAQVMTLRTRLRNGGMFVSGWDRNEFSIKTCKAVPDDQNATARLREISMTTSGNGDLTVAGPADGEWMASLIVMAPRLSRMDLDTSNGPLHLRELAGVLRLRATNGPVQLQGVGGVIETNATNGPISIAGASGDLRVSATNGPVNIELSGSRWDGPGLDIAASNGPVSLGLPDGYGSSIQVRTSDRAPLNCTAAACAGAVRTGDSGMFRIGNGEPVVRLSATNGPLRIQRAR
jgi:hypothetical protein